MPCYVRITVAQGISNLEELYNAAKAMEYEVEKTQTYVSVTIEGRRLTFYAGKYGNPPWSEEASERDLKKLRQGKNIHNTVAALRKKGWNVRPKSRKVKDKTKVELIMIKA